MRAMCSWTLFAAQFPSIPYDAVPKLLRGKPMNPKDEVIHGLVIDGNLTEVSVKLRLADLTSVEFGGYQSCLIDRYCRNWEIFSASFCS